MKRLTTLLIYIAFAMMNIYGSNKEKAASLPDFNFPKTVIKNAEAQLKNALAKADGEATVDALIKYSIAKSSISDETFSEVIKKLDDVIAKEKYEDIRAILLFLESEIYLSHEDRDEADSCYALAIKNEAELRAHNIEEYQKIIKSDALGRSLCPTLYDFLKYKRLGTSYILENLADGEMQGFRLIHSYGDENIYQKLVDYAKTYPSSPWINDIKNRIYEFEAQSASANYPSQWHSTMPVNITVNSHNAKEVTLTLYKYPTLPADKENNRIAFNKLKKLFSKDVTFEQDTVFFDSKQEITIDPLPEGTYHVEVVVNGKSNRPNYVYDYNALHIKNTTTYTIDRPEKDSLHVIHVDIKSGLQVKEEMEKKKWHSDFESGTNPRMTILTDLGIYRPDETVHYTLIYKEVSLEQKQLLSGKTIKMELRDNYGKVVAADTLVTDAYGQLAGEFRIPTDLTNGRFSIFAQDISSDGKHHATANKIIVVSEYKIPTFYIDIAAIPHVFEKDKDVILRGKVLTYSGIPLAHGEVKITVEKRMWWWRFSPMYLDDSVIALTAITNENGEFEATIPQNDINSGTRYFQASFMVTDEAGESQEAKCDFFIGEQRALYYEGPHDFIIDTPISLPISLMSSDSKDKIATFHYALYDKRNPDVVVKEGTLNTQNTTLNLRKLKSSTYIFTAKLLDDEQELREEIVLFHKDDKVCPTESPLWVPSCGKSVDSNGMAHIIIGNTSDSHIYYVANSRKGLVKEGWLDYKPGMHELKMQIPEGDDQYIVVELLCYYNCRLYRESVRLNNNASFKKLTLNVSSFRDKIFPNSTETWTFSLTDNNGNPADGRLALEVISEAVNQLQPNVWNYSTELLSSRFTSLQARGIGARSADGYWSEKPLKGAKYSLPELNMYDHYFRWGTYFHSRPMAMYARSLNAVAEDMQYDMAAPVYSASMKMAAMDDDSAESIEEETAVTGDGGADNIYNNVRASETKVALWQPMVSVGEDGEVSVSFEVPSDNTTWRMQALAFNSAAESNTLSQTVVAQRRVMVKPSLPRFLRSGDKTTLFANVMNSSEETVSAEVKITLFDPRTDKTLGEKTEIVEIPANGMKAVGIEAEAYDNLANLGFRVVAVEIGSDKGKTSASDGEQQMLPILPAVTRVVETIPFYLNPTDGDSIIDISHFPAEAEITYEFCNNPVWYCLSALPTIYDADIKTATGLAHNFYAVTLAELLCSKYKPDVPFDQETKQKLIKALCNLQNPDGGISWFDWKERESSEYVTYQVLELLGELKKLNSEFALCQELSIMVEKALRYYEQQQLEHLAEMKKYDKKVDYTRFDSYLYLRTLYPATEYAIPAQNVSLLKKTLDVCEKDWRNFSLPSRGFLALSLNRNGKEKTARNIVESLRQFAMTDTRRGMFWDNLQSFGYRWYNRTALTALMLEVFDEVDDSNTAQHLHEIDEIRKWLLLEKQTTDWGSASMAAEATFALLSTGSEWLVADSIEQGAQYTKTIIDSREPIEVKHKTGHPAWGAIYAKFPTEISKAKAFKLEEIALTKELRSHDGGKIKKVSDIKTGDKLQVQLTIKTDRDMQYVTIRDNRAACFEPVDKTSGYRFSDNNVKNRQNIGYYNDTKDTETRILINFLPKGEHVITYDVYVTNAGTFCTGIAEVTCEYAPQFTSHTAGAILSVFSGL